MTGTTHAVPDRAPLSLQLDFLRLMGGGSESGPFGPRYTIVHGWRIFGRADIGALTAALADVVSRHEALRTKIVLDDGGYQLIYPPAPVELNLTDLGTTPPGTRDAAAEYFINEIEESVPVGDEPPRLRAALGRFDPHDAVLVLSAHHSVVDGWSMQVLMRDLAACYAARKAGREPGLPPVRQYRDYAAWQLGRLNGSEVASARRFWREYLDGAQIVPLPTDRPRSADAYTTGWYRFMLSEQFRTGILQAAKQHRSSPFIVLMAAFMSVMRDRTGQTDLVIPTMLTGRSPGWTEDVIGTFYNFVPVRADLSRCDSFSDTVARVRAACLAAYAHELPFPLIMAEAPELMGAAVQPDAAAAAFVVIQHGVGVDRGDVGGLRIVPVRQRMLSTPVGSQIPDGVLARLELHPEGGVSGTVGYVGHLFDEDTIIELMSAFKKTVKSDVMPASIAA
jgi:condensation enzyme